MWLGVKLEGCNYGHIYGRQTKDYFHGCPISRNKRNWLFSLKSNHPEGSWSQQNIAVQEHTKGDSRPWSRDPMMYTPLTFFKAKIEWKTQISKWFEIAVESSDIQDCGMKPTTSIKIGLSPVLKNLQSEWSKNRGETSGEWDTDNTVQMCNSNPRSESNGITSNRCMVWKTCTPCWVQECFEWFQLPLYRQWAGFLESLF